MDSATLQTILGGVIVAGILWLARSVSQFGVDLATIKTTLVGQSGQNGLNSEVAKLRDRSHAHGDAIHALEGKHELLSLRVSTIEERA